FVDFAAARATTAHRLLERLRRIAQRDHVTGSEPLRDDDTPGGAAAKLDLDRLEAVRATFVNDVLALLADDRLARHDERIGLVENQRRAHALAGLHHGAVGLFEVDDNREVLDRYARHARLRELIDELDRSLVCDVGLGFDDELDWLLLRDAI